jgi:Concanavalin A-like lectin/glucanases superfamily
MANSTLTLTRTTTGDAIAVKIAVTGTAILGTDYAVVSGADSFTAGIMTVTIPASQTSKDVVVNSLGAAITTVKTLTFTIVDEPGSIGITPKTDTLNIWPVPVGDVLDQLSVEPVIAASLSRRLRRLYTGNCCRIAKVGGNNVFEVPFLSNGLPDWAAALTYAAGGSALFDIIYNQGSAGAAGNIFPSFANERTLAIENGVLQIRHGRPAMLQQLNKKMEIPNAALIPAGNQNWTINYVAGMSGISSGEILSGQSPQWIFGFNGGGKRTAYFNGAGTLATPGDYPAGKNLEIFTARATLGSSPLTYNNGLPFTNTAPNYAPGANLLTNAVNNLYSSHSYFSEIIIFNTSISPAQQLAVERSQKAWYGLSTIDNEFFSEVALQLDFNDTQSNPFIIRDRSFKNFPVSITGNASISTVDSFGGGGCLLLPGGSAGSFNVQLPAPGSELIVLANQDFMLNIGVKPAASPTNIKNIFIGSTGATGLTLTNTGQLQWWQDGPGNIAITATGVLGLANYSHIAVLRINNILKIFVNGTFLVSSGTYSNSIDFRGWRIGSGQFNNNWDGRIGYLRLLRGITLDPSIVPASKFAFNPFN